MKNKEKELTTNCEKLNLSHRIIRIVRKDYFGEEELLDVIEVKHIRQFIRDLKKSNWQYLENSWGEQQRIFSIGENDINTLVGDELK